MSTAAAAATRRAGGGGRKKQRADRFGLPVPSEPAQNTVVEALKFVKTSVYPYHEDFLFAQTLSPQFKAVSANLRANATISVILIVIEVILQLSKLARDFEGQLKFEEYVELKTHPTGDIDYTIQLIWAKWAQEIEDARNDQKNWERRQAEEWNPYGDTADALEALANFIARKHFQ